MNGEEGEGVQRKGCDGHMCRDSICALADRFHGIEKGSDSRLRKESVGVWVLEM